jgi:hypothetical protein
MADATTRRHPPGAFERGLRSAGRGPVRPAVQLSGLRRLRSLSGASRIPRLRHRMGGAATGRAAAAAPRRAYGAARGRGGRGPDGPGGRLRRRHRSGAFARPWHRSPHPCAAALEHRKRQQRERRQQRRQRQRQQQQRQRQQRQRQHGEHRPLPAREPAGPRDRRHRRRADQRPGSDGGRRRGHRRDPHLERRGAHEQSRHRGQLVDDGHAFQRADGPGQGAG